MIDVGTPKFLLGGQTDYAALVTGFSGEVSTLSVVTRDPAGVPHRPASVSLQVWDGSTGRLMQEIPATFLSAGTWRANFSVPAVGTWLARWRSSDGHVGVQTLIGMDARLQHLLMMVRAMLDKSLKEKDKTWGYTDSDLFVFFNQGLSYFNNTPPITNVLLGGIPFYLDGLLVDLATLYGIQSQIMFSVDTDVNYADQGINLNIDHFGKLTGVYSLVFDRVNTSVRQYKYNFIGAARMVAAYNPERARGLLFSRMLTQGFPYFAIYGLDVSFLFRG